MSAAVGSTVPGIDKAEQLHPEVRDALRSLLLILADNKRLLGIRYSDWMLGAPTLESGIAASSMAQDEWGHGRLTYALLSDFGDNPKEIEHEREASGYHSSELLDRPFRSWTELVAVNLILDTALAIQYGALVDSRYTPVHNRVQKLLDEERFHFQHAVGWSRQLLQAAAVWEEFREALARVLPTALRWFGRENSRSMQRLLDEGMIRDGPDALRGRLLAQVAPVLEAGGLAQSLGTTRDGEQWSYALELDWVGWDDSTRRAGGAGPDAETLARVRGDKNRALLLD